MAERPIHILPWDGTLGPEHMQKLAESATSRTDHPSAPGAVIFTFSASEINDVRDSTIIADPGSARYSADRAPGCVCRKAKEAIRCDCQKAERHACGQTFMAIENACAFALCLYDECELCAHQREDCMFKDIRQATAEEFAAQLRERPEDGIAAAAYSAIAETIGADSGDAPDFSAAPRILAAMTGESAGADRWPFSDGTDLRPYGSSGAWLEIEPAKTRRTIVTGAREYNEASTGDKR